MARMRTGWGIPLALVLALGVLASGAHAQGNSQPPSDQTTPPPGVDPKLWEVLTIDRANNKAMATAKGKDAPIVAFTGNLGSGPANDPGKVAADFVKKYGTLLGFPANADLKALCEPLGAPKTTAQGTMLQFAPAEKRVPFLKATTSFTVDPTGKLTAVVGRYTSVAGARTGSLDAKAAIARAMEEIHKEDPTAEMTGDGQFAESLVEVSPGSIQENYLVSLTVGRPPLEIDVTLGPGGELVRKGVGSKADDPDAKVFATYPPSTDGATVQPLKDITNPVKHDAKWGLLGGLAGAGVGAIVGALSDYKISGDYFESDSSYSPAASDFHGHFRCDPFAGSTAQPNLANPQFLECNVYYHLTVAREKLIGWGAHEVEDMTLVFDVWRPLKYDRDRGFKSHAELQNNACYNPSDDRLEFCARNPSKGDRSPAMDMGVIYHEFGHKVHEALAPRYEFGGSSSDQLEANAVSEGVGDTWAAAILNDPIKSLWWYGEIRRRADQTLTVDQVTPCNDDASVPEKEIHMAGQVISGMFWDMKNKFGTDDAMKIFVGGLRYANKPHTFHNVGLGMLVSSLLTPGMAGHFMDVVNVMVARGLAGSTRTAANPTGD